MKFACKNVDSADRALLGLPECLFNLCCQIIYFEFYHYAAEYPCNQTI